MWLWVFGIVTNHSCSLTSSLDGIHSSERHCVSLTQRHDLWLRALLHSWLLIPNLMRECIITSTKGGGYVTASIHLFAVTKRT